jgi:hypothetical protein
VAGEPSGDVPDGRRGRRQRRRGGAALAGVAADDGVAAVVAECPDLAEQLGAVAAALAGALVQVRLERVELAGPRLLPAAVGEFLPGGGAGVALDGVQAQPRCRAISRRPRPWASRSCTMAWCRRARSAYFPAGSGRPASATAGAGPGSSAEAGEWTGSARQARCAATHFSAALARFCHRWNRSATWIASGAPVRAPSKGIVGYQNCLNALACSAACRVTAWLIVVSSWSVRSSRLLART